jgi:hypothetical protein
MAAIHYPRQHTVKPPVGAQVNRAHPLADRLLVQWLMNEGGGSVVYDSARGVGGNSGTITAATWTGHHARAGQAIDFANTAGGTSSQYIDFGDIGVFTGLTEYTLQWWVRFDSVSSFQSVQHKDGTFNFQLNAGDPYLVAFPGGSSAYTIPPAMSANVWTDLVFVWAAGSAQAVYYNGISQTLSLTGSGSGGLANPGATMRLGGSGSSGEGFDGQLALQRVWGRALNGREVADLHAAPFGMLLP